MASASSGPGDTNHSHHRFGLGAIEGARLRRLEAALLRELADGKWHRWEQVWMALYLQVPSGIAHREAEHARVILARRRAARRGQHLREDEVPARDEPVDSDELWRMGAKIILRRMMYRQGFEWTGDWRQPGERKVRYRPPRKLTR